MEFAVEQLPQTIYAQRARIILKLLENYIDKSELPRFVPSLGLSELPILVEKKAQEPIMKFLQHTLHCKVSYGKDRFGQRNGYIIICLDNSRLNPTGLYRGQIALQKL